MITYEYFNSVYSNINLQAWFTDLFLERLGVKPDLKFKNGQYIFLFKQGNNKLGINFTSNGRIELFKKENSDFFIINNDNRKFHQTRNLIPKNGLVLYGINSLNWFTENNSDALLTINYDFPAYLFWTLNRIEEYGVKSDDIHDRFQLKNSHLQFSDLYLRPIVDEWFLYIEGILKNANFSLKDKKFSFSISHDIDEISRYHKVPLFRVIPKIMKDIIFNPIRLIKYISNVKFYTENESANCFNWLMLQSEKVGVKSKFYFIPSNSSLKFDYRYKLNNHFIKEILKNINQRGHEIGIHYSYNASIGKFIINEWMSFKSLCNSLSIKISGGRMHYLRISFLETLRQLSDSSQNYDNTLTFYEKGGFRSGTCFKYKPFDIFNLNTLSIEINPLILMDDTLLSYMNIEDSSMSFMYIKKLIDRCFFVGGEFSLLWHNTNLNTEEKRELYIRILAYCKSLKNSSST